MYMGASKGPQAPGRRRFASGHEGRDRWDLDLLSPDFPDAGDAAGDLDRAVERGGAFEGDHAVLGVDRDAVAARFRMSREGDLHTRGEGARRDEATADV